MTLLYEDHFDSPNLDTVNWGHSMGVYTIQDSNLILGGSGRGGEVRGYKGSNPFAMKYGYIEIRAKFGGAGSNKGFVNQLWLIQTNDQMSDEYEIDITETPTGPINNNDSWQGINKMNSTYHWGNYSGSKEKFYNTNVDLSQDYHLYAMEWTTSYIRYLFNNQETLRVTNNISNLDMYIILGLCSKCYDEEAAGCWSSEECASGNAKLYVDYVRVYDAKPNGQETHNICNSNNICEQVNGIDTNYCNNPGESCGTTNYYNTCDNGTCTQHSGIGTTNCNNPGGSCISGSEGAVSCLQIGNNCVPYIYIIIGLGVLYLLKK